MTTNCTQKELDDHLRELVERQMRKEANRPPLPPLPPLPPPIPPPPPPLATQAPPHNSKHKDTSVPIGVEPLRTPEGANGLTNAWTETMRRTGGEKRRSGRDPRTRTRPPAARRRVFGRAAERRTNISTTGQELVDVSSDEDWDNIPLKEREPREWYTVYTTPRAPPQTPPRTYGIRSIFDTDSE